MTMIETIEPWIPAPISLALRTVPTHRLILVIAATPTVPVLDLPVLVAVVPGRVRVRAPARVLAPVAVQVVLAPVPVVLALVVPAAQVLALVVNTHAH